MPDDRFLQRAEKSLKRVLARPSNGDRIAHIRLDLGRMMNEKVQVFRQEEPLKKPSSKSRP